MMRAKFLFILITIHFFLWALFVPVFEPSDERGYYQGLWWAVNHSPLINYREIFSVPRHHDEPGVIIHGPFYYITLWPMARLLPLPSGIDGASVVYNPERLTRFRHGVYNSYFHRPEERRWAWSQLEWSVHILRLVSLVYGLGTVWLVYRFGVKVFGKQSILPEIGMIFVGLNPMFAHIFSALTVIHLLVFLYSLFIYIGMTQLGKRWAPLVMGMIGGLATLTKLTGLFTLPLALIIFGWRQKKLKAVKPLFMFGLGYGATAGWYLVRSIMLYGSILPFKEISEVTFGRVDYKYQLGLVNFVIDFFLQQFKTFWSGYGYQVVHLPDWLLYGLFTIMFIAMWGVGMFLMDKKRWDNLPPKRWWWTAIIIYGVYMIGLFRAHWWFPAFHAKDQYPMMLIITVLVLLGIKLAWEKFWQEGRRGFKLGWVLLPMFWGISLFVSSRVNLVDLWRGNWSAGLIIGKSGLLIALGMTGIITGLEMVRRWSQIKTWAEVRKNSLVVLASLVVFLLNAWLLIGKVTPTLFGDRNVPMETWQQQQQGN